MAGGSRPRGPGIAREGALNDDLSDHRVDAFDPLIGTFVAAEAAGRRLAPVVRDAGPAREQARLLDGGVIPAA